MFVKDQIVRFYNAHQLPIEIPVQFINTVSMKNDLSGVRRYSMYFLEYRWFANIST